MVHLSLERLGAYRAKVSIYPESSHLLWTGHDIVVYSAGKTAQSIYSCFSLMTRTWHSVRKIIVCYILISVFFTTVCVKGLTHDRGSRSLAYPASKHIGHWHSASSVCWLWRQKRMEETTRTVTMMTTEFTTVAGINSYTRLWRKLQSQHIAWNLNVELGYFLRRMSLSLSPIDDGAHRLAQAPSSLSSKRLWARMIPSERPPKIDYLMCIVLSNKDQNCAKWHKRKITPLYLARWVPSLWAVPPDPWMHLFYCSHQARCFLYPHLLSFFVLCFADD